MKASKPETLQARFGRRVRELRAEAGFSQEAFANECNMDRTYLSGVERGVRNVSLVNIGRLAHGLNLSIAQLTVGV